MPFTSKRQWRAAFAGKIPGISPSQAHEWAHSTPSFKDLPDRAPDEKGKPTLRSKEANGDMIQHFIDHPEKLKEKKERDRRELASKLERKGLGGQEADDIAAKKIANYKLHGERMFRGLDCAIENAKGSKRYWHDPHGKEKGSTLMHFDYGYIRGSKGTDGDHVDVYLGPDENAENVYLVDQMKKPDFKEFDEQKCMLGFKDEASAKAAYLKQYNDPKFFGGMKTMKFDEFKEKVLDKKNHGSKLAASAGWIREHAVKGLADRSITLDGKQQAQIARKAVDYARAKETNMATAGGARSQLQDVLGNFKKMQPNAGRRSSTSAIPEDGLTPEGRQHIHRTVLGITRAPSPMFALAPAAITGIQRSGEQAALEGDLRKAKRGKEVAERPESPGWRAADAIATPISSGYPTALLGGLGGAIGDAVRHGAAPKSKFSPALTIAGAAGGGVLGAAFGHAGHRKREQKIEGLRDQIADAQMPKAASGDRVGRIADRLDDVGIATLASPIIADAAEHGLKGLMMRGGRLGALAAEGHTLAQGASSFLHAHPHAVEGAGLALVAPGVTHTLARGVNKIAPARPVPPAPQEPMVAGRADQGVFKQAGDIVGRMLAREKTAINVGTVASTLGRAAWNNRRTIAGIGAVGAVAGGLYGAKKTVDAATNLATQEREPARYAGVTPGMRPPAPVTMI